MINCCSSFLILDPLLKSDCWWLLFQDQQSKNMFCLYFTTFSASIITCLLCVFSVFAYIARLVMSVCHISESSSSCAVLTRCCSSPGSEPSRLQPVESACSWWSLNLAISVTHSICPCPLSLYLILPFFDHSGPMNQAVFRADETARELQSVCLLHNIWWQTCFSFASGPLTCILATPSLL